MEALLGHRSESGPPRKVLLLTTNFGPDQRGTPLFDDLAGHLVRSGHRVHVLSLGWSSVGKSLRDADGLLTVTHLPALRSNGLLGLAGKWLLSSIKAAWYDRVRLRKRWDIVIAGSPATALALPIFLSTRTSRLSYCYITDFFPFHQVELGRFPPGPAARFARHLEAALLRRFDVIGCMSPKGIDYLRKNYRTDVRQKHEVLPLWSEFRVVADRGRGLVRSEWGLPADDPIAIFGGQLVTGRGVEEIVAAAEKAFQEGSKLRFLIVGDGPLSEFVRRRAATINNLLIRKGVERSKYLELLTACDVGIVATVANVSVPTFPSKTLDYLSAGLPIVASVEKSTDFGDFIIRNGLGASIEAGDGARLFATIELLVSGVSNRQEVAAYARKALEQHFKVSSAAGKILSHINPTDGQASQ